MTSQRHTRCVQISEGPLSLLYILVLQSLSWTIHHHTANYSPINMYESNNAACNRESKQHHQPMTGRYAEAPEYDPSSIIPVTSVSRLAQGRDGMMFRVRFEY